MAEMPMPMTSQEWPSALVSFLGMWAAMTAAMMLPSVAPALWRFRQAAARDDHAHPGLLTGSAGAGYSVVWLAVGVAVFSCTVMPAVQAVSPPIGTGAALLLAGAWQLTARRTPNAGTPARDVGSAWRFGVRTGIASVRGCGVLMVILFALGVMDLRVMTVAGIIIAVLSPSSWRACWHSARSLRARAP